MKKLILAIGLVAFLASCGNENTSTNNSTNTTPPANNAAASQQPTVNNPVDGQQQPAQIQTAPVNAAQPATAVSDPNPEHGQPGHRCDIPVGASLSTPVRQQQPMQIGG